MQAQIDRLLERFRKIDRERMQGLPFHNPQLHVEALGFVTVDNDSAGVLITPWFINLIFLFGQAPVTQAQTGQRCRHSLPGGEFDFMVGEDEELGRYDFISLASPVSQFRQQLQARDFAWQKSRLYLLMPEQVQPDEHPLVFVEHAPADLSRRRFLTGETPR